MSILRATLTGTVATFLSVAPGLITSGTAPVASVLGSSVAVAQSRYDEPRFYEQLQPYGYWANHPRYGEVWMPAEVDEYWRPYEDGRWTYTEAWGWYFDASTEWGDVVFHYGRWAWDQQWGWMWLPGEEWGPGWVSWRQTEAHVGWAPLGPGDETYQDDEDYWSFVEAPALFQPRLLMSQVVVRRPAIIREVWRESRYYGRPVVERPRNTFIDLRMIQNRYPRIVVRPQPVTVRVAFDPRGQPIGYRGRIDDVGFRVDRARARPGPPSPIVTQRIIEGVRAGRLDADRPIIRQQIVRATREGTIRFDERDSDAAERIRRERDRDFRGGDQEVDRVIDAVRTGRVRTEGVPEREFRRREDPRPIRGEDADRRRPDGDVRRREEGPDVRPRGPQDAARPDFDRPGAGPRPGVERDEPPRGPRPPIGVVRPEDVRPDARPRPDEPPRGVRPETARPGPERDDESRRPPQNAARPGGERPEARRPERPEDQQRGRPPEVAPGPGQPPPEARPRLDEAQPVRPREEEPSRAVSRPDRSDRPDRPDRPEPRGAERERERPDPRVIDLNRRPAERPPEARRPEPAPEPQRARPPEAAPRAVERAEPRRVEEPREAPRPERPREVRPQAAPPQEGARGAGAGQPREGQRERRRDCQPGEEC